MKEFRLPRTAKAAIKVWLELPTEHIMAKPDKGVVCPFGGIIGIYRTHDGLLVGKYKDLPCLKICAKIFPSLGQSRDCPCHRLSLAHVIKKAKEIIR